MGFTLRQLAVEIGFRIKSSDLDSLDRRLGRTKGTIRSLGFLLAGFTAGLTGGIASILSASSTIEDVTIVIDTLSDSLEESAFLMEELKNLTRRTPFTFQELAASALQLKSVGIETEKIISDLIMIGDIAAGSPKASLKSLVDIFAQVRAGGKVFGRQMVRFRLGAIPVITELAQKLNITTTAASRMFRTQQVTFDDLRDLFKFMTSESGRFSNLMEKRAKTLSGAWSIIKDILFLIRAEIGEQGLLGEAKRLQKSFALFLETNKKLIVLRLGKFFNNIAKEMIVLARRFRKIIMALIRMTSLFGGVERVTRALLNTFALLIALQIVAWVGKLGIAFVSLAGSILLGRKSMMMFNLLAGAGIIGLLLLLDDLRAFFEGEGSITGLIVDSFENKFPAAFAGTKAALIALGQFFFGLWETVVGTLTFDLDKIKKGFGNLRESLRGTVLEMLGKDFISMAKILLGVLTLNPALISQGLGEIGAIETAFEKKGLEVEKKLAGGLARFFKVPEKRIGELQAKNFPLIQALKESLGAARTRGRTAPFSTGFGRMSLATAGPGHIMNDISINAPATISISGVSDPKAAVAEAKEQFDNNLGEVIIQATGAVTPGEK